jgi:hypothetical protein
MEHAVQPTVDNFDEMHLEIFPHQGWFEFESPTSLGVSMYKRRYGVIFANVLYIYDRWVLLLS